MKKELGIFILLVVLCAVTGFENPRFFSHANLVNTANLIGLFGIFSIGAGMVIITSGIDLSVGSMVALNGMLSVLALTEWHWPWPVAVLFALAIPMLLGLAHGVLIAQFKMQPFIVTLCGLLLYRGIARFIANDMTKGFGEAQGFEHLQQLAAGSILGFPTPFVYLIVIAIIMWFVLHRSVYGRYLLAVGRNEEATRYSGVNTKLVVGGTYVLAGLLTGISGILFAFYTNSVSPSTQGNFYELYGIAAAVLGGCSLRGGEGSIIGILIGTTLLLVLQNLVNLLGIPSSLNFAVMGAVVLVGVLADQLFKNRKKSRS
jgi:ribose transport system permease protein